MAVVLPHHSNSGLLLPGQVRSIPKPYFAVPDGLVGYWGFDPDCIDGTIARDLTANGNNGVINGSGSVLLSDGQIGTALLFDGSSNNVVIPDSPSLSISGAITVAMWCNPSFLPSGANFAFLLAKTFQDGTSCFKMLLDGPDNGGVLRYEFLIVQSGSNVIVADTTTTPVTGQWIFLVGTYDLANLRFWTNAQLMATTPATGPIDTQPTDPVYIGSNQLGFPAYFTGALDDVRIYNRALGAGEIMQLYQAGLAKQRHSSLVIPEDAEAQALFLPSTGSPVLNLWDIPTLPRRGNVELLSGGRGTPSNFIPPTGTPPKAQYDWPVPNRVRHSLFPRELGGTTIYFPSTVRPPIALYDWPVPMAPARGAIDLRWAGQGTPVTLFPTPVAQPFNQYAWPVPQAYLSSVGLKTWSQSIALTLNPTGTLMGAMWM